MQSSATGLHVYMYVGQALHTILPSFIGLHIYYLNENAIAMSHLNLLPKARKKSELLPYSLSLRENKTGSFHFFSSKVNFFVQQGPGMNVVKVQLNSETKMWIKMLLIWQSAVANLT